MVKITTFHDRPVRHVRHDVAGSEFSMSIFSMSIFRCRFFAEVGSTRCLGFDVQQQSRFFFDLTPTIKKLKKRF